MGPILDPTVARRVDVAGMAPSIHDELAALAGDEAVALVRRDRLGSPAEPIERRARRRQLRDPIES